MSNPDRAFDYVLVTGALGLLPRAALQDMARVCQRELRFLEPLEKNKVGQ